MRRGMEAISLRHCSGVIEAQVALIVAFRSSFWLSLAVSYNHQNVYKKTFEVFYFTCNEFFHYIQFFLDVPV